MKLTFAPRTRAVRARWLLEELGRTYELVVGTNAPVLVDDTVTLTESSAIILYLARGTALESKAVGAYLQWLLFAEVTLDSLLLVHPDDAKLAAALEAVNAHLTNREFVAGDAFSAADIVMSSVLHLAYSRKQLGNFPTLVEYTHRHTARLSSRRAVSRDES